MPPRLSVSNGKPVDTAGSFAFTLGTAASRLKGRPPGRLYFRAIACHWVSGRATSLYIIRARATSVMIWSRLIIKRYFILNLSSTLRNSDDMLAIVLRYQEDMLFAPQTPDSLGLSPFLIPINTGALALTAA